MKTKVIASVLVLGLLAIAVSSVEAGRRGRSWNCTSCCTASVTGVTTVAVFSKKKCISTFTFVPIADFTSNSEETTINASKEEIAISLDGPSDMVATFIGETIKITAKCQVKLPPEHMRALKKVGNDKTMGKAVNVSLEATLEEGTLGNVFALFSRQDIADKVNAKLQRIRFWDHPALFGLEEFDIVMTGKARIGSFCLKSTNKQILGGVVE